jgi:probable F420-dependent oxidoreductase
LTAIAMRTRRIQLATGILIAPLRSAILLAKQLATLDQLAHGRLVAGLGAGWQQSEYDFSALPWAKRFSYLAEQIEAIRALWGPQPASFTGAQISFAEAFALPRPYRDRTIPIWLGLGLGPRNLDRIVRLADGWLPLRTDVAGILEETKIVRDACAAAGRTPGSLLVRASPAAGLPGAERDLSRLADEIAKLAEGGVDMVQVYPFGLADSAAECDSLFERLIAIRDSLTR